MIAFVLHDPGMKSAGFPLDRLARRGHAAISDMRMARDPAGEPRYGKARFPIFVLLIVQRRDLRVDQNCRWHLGRVLAGRAFAWQEEDDHPLADMDLRRRQSYSPD